MNERGPGLDVLDKDPFAFVLGGIAAELSLLQDGFISLPALALGLPCDNLVSMTRTKKTPQPPDGAKARRHALHVRLPGHWLLQDAKARFSELVRRVRSEGPQHVTVHGRDEVVVLSAEEFRRLKGERSGEALIAAMQASPYRDIDIEPTREPMPVREVDL